MGWMRIEMVEAEAQAFLYDVACCVRSCWLRYGGPVPVWHKESEEPKACILRATDER